MSQQTKKKDRTNTIQLMLLLVVVIATGYYTMVSLTSRDPLWLLKGFQDHPSRIVVYHAGQRTELSPGQAGFDELADAVQTSLSQNFARLSNLGFSEKTLQEAYTQHVTLEVFWERPVELHTWFHTGRVTQMLFPVAGRHAELSVVLLGDEGRYRPGAPVLNTVEPIRETLKSLGFY